MRSSTSRFRNSLAGRSCIAVAAGLLVCAALAYSIEDAGARQPRSSVVLVTGACALLGLFAVAELAEAVLRREPLLGPPPRALLSAEAAIRERQLLKQIDQLQYELESPLALDESAASAADSRRGTVEAQLKSKQAELAGIENESQGAFASLGNGRDEADLLRLRLQTMRSEERMLMSQRESHERRLAELQTVLAAGDARLREQAAQLAACQVPATITTQPNGPNALPPDGQAIWQTSHERSFAVSDALLAVDARAPASTDEAIELATQRLATLCRQEAEARARLADTTKSLETEVNQLESVVRLNAQRRAQIETAHQRLQDAEQAVNQADARLRQAQHELGACQSRLDSLQDEERVQSGSLQEAKAKEDAIVREITALGVERDSLWAAVDALRKETSELSARRNGLAGEAAALAAEVEAHGARRDALAREAPMLEQRQATAQSRLDEVLAKMAETERLCCERETELEQWQARVSTGYEEAGALERQCRQLTAERRGAESRIAECKQALHEAEERLAATEIRRQDAQGALPELEVRLAALTAEHEKSRESVRKDREAAAGAAAKRQQIEREWEQLRDEHDRRLAQRREQLDAVEAALADHALATQARQAEIDRLETSLGELHAQSEISLRQAIEAEERREAAERNQAEQLRKMQWLIDGRQQDLTDYEQRLADQRRQAADLQERCSRTSDKIERLQVEEAESRKSRQDWEAYVAALEGQARQAEAELDRLEQELVLAATELETRQSKLAEAETALAEKQREWDRVLERTSRATISRPQRPESPARGVAAPPLAAAVPFAMGNPEDATPVAAPADETRTTSTWDRAESWGQYLAELSQTVETAEARHPPDLWHETAGATQAPAEKSPQQAEADEPRDSRTVSLS